MNSFFSIFLSTFSSPFVALLMAGTLLIHIPIAWKQSKKYAKVLICFSAALTLALLVDVFILNDSRTKSVPIITLTVIVQFILILSSILSLVAFHNMLRNNFYHIEDKFLKVFNTSPHGMMIVKISDATIKEVNTAFSRVSGYPAEDVLGKSVVDLGLWHQPQQRDEMLSVLLNYQSLGPVEYKFMPKSGVPTKYLYSAQLIIINGEKFLVSHIEEKPDKSSSGFEAKNLLKQKLRETMANEALFKIPRLTLSDLAEKLDTNKTYLSQVINSEYGNFSEYLNKFRVIEACRLIQIGLDPRLSIDSLFSEVGFSSRTVFYEAFRKFTGVSPARFRQINTSALSTKSKSKK